MQTASFAFMCVIWGLTWLAMKAGVASVPPLVFAGTRFLAAGTVLVALCLLRGVPLPVTRTDLPRLAAVTALMVVATYALLFWGMLFVSSGVSAVLDLAPTPVALLVIGVLLGDGWGLHAVLGWLFLVLFGSLLAYTIFLRLLRDWGPVRAGSYAYISPLIAMLAGVVVLHEQVTPFELAGVAAMLAGAWLCAPAKGGAVSGAPSGQVQAGKAA